MPSFAISSGYYRNGRAGGVEQAVYGYLDALAYAAEPDDVVRLYTPSVVKIPKSSHVEMVEHRGRFENRFLWESFDLPRIGGDCPIFFPHYFTPPTLPKRRKVTVICDLQYRHLPHNFTASKRAWLRSAHAATLRLADAVVAISQFTRDDILRLHGDRYAEKLHVIPTAINWRALDPGRATVPAFAPRLRGHPFVLSVSAQWAHKNFETLIRGFALARARRPDLRLVLAGRQSRRLSHVFRRGLSASEIVAELQLERYVIETGHIPESELAWLYREASIAVFPSLFEGHGRPATESIGLGLPTLTTRLTAIPEATDGLAVYMDDPLSVWEMADRIVEMTDAPASFIPGAMPIARLRHRFSPEAIGPRLRRVLMGTESSMTA
jgi:glycosyltransferase involved in cell wall biosynthesis